MCLLHCVAWIFLRLCLSFKTSKVDQEPVAMGMSLHSSFCHFHHTCTRRNRGVSRWGAFGSLGLRVCLEVRVWQELRARLPPRKYTRTKTRAIEGTADGPLHSPSLLLIRGVSPDGTVRGSRGEQRTALTLHLHCCTLWILKQSSYCQVHLHRVTELQHSVLKGLIKHWKWFLFPFLL